MIDVNTTKTHYPKYVYNFLNIVSTSCILCRLIYRDMAVCNVCFHMA